MAPRPTEAMYWFYRIFKARKENAQLLMNNPEDWSRLQVWNGTSLQPAMPQGFFGVPNEADINRLFSYVQNNQLFFFNLGDPRPEMLTAKAFVPIPKDPKEPIAPPPFNITDPTERQVKDYNQSVRDHEKLLAQYHMAQDLHKNNPSFQTAVDGYLASRNPERDNNELNSRKESSYLQWMQNSRAKADRTISQMMAPRPVPSPDVFYEDEQESNNATIDYRHFDTLLEPNGYDLPKDSKLDDNDAATINFAMLGAEREMQKFFYEQGAGGPIYSKSDARNGFNMMVTGLFGYTRIAQPLAHALGKAMQLGKEAIEAYQGGDASLLGQRLGDCVRSIQELFTGTQQHALTDSMAAPTKLTERLLDLFERNPDIWEATGLTEQDREYMRGFVQVGKIYDNYANNQIKFNDAKFKGTQLSEAETAEILADAVIRKMVEKQLKEDSDLAEESDEYQAGLQEAMAKDAVANQKYNQWEAENRKKFKTYNEFDVERQKQLRLLDVNAHVTVHYSLPCKHPIFAKLAQPGMLEHLRQNLMKDPAILAQAGKLLAEYTPANLAKGAKLDALIEPAQQLVEFSQKQAWFDNVKAMLTKEDPNAWLDPNVASDSNRLMIAQANGRRGKKLVSVANLLADGMATLQNPDKNAIELLYESAKNGNLFFYNKGKDMPLRLGADDMKPSAQQLEAVKLPTPWMRFLNKITFGWAYAKECNLPDRDPATYELIVQARADHAAPAQTETEAPQQTKPQPVPVKPWKYRATDTRNMTNEAFFAHVKAAYERSNDLNATRVLNSENCTPETYFTVMTQLLESKFAGEIYLKADLASTPEAKNMILEAHKKTYTATVNGLGDYVVNHTDKGDLAAHCSHPQEYSPEYTALCQSSSDILRNGVNGYLNQLNRENAANEQKKQQEQPKNETVLTNNEPEKDSNTIAKR